MLSKNPYFYSVLLRVISVFAIQTSFAPDEYWQSIEIAHKLAFNYGYETWEWTMGIRSYLYPFVISLMYRMLAWLNLDNYYFIMTLPRIMQATVCAIADNFFAAWYFETTGNRSEWAAFSIMTSWFWFYCCSRTLTNTMETVLTIFALYCYPWNVVEDKQIVKMKSHKIRYRLYKPHVDRSKRPSYLWFVCIACLVRPTTVIIWLPMCVLDAWSTEDRKKLLIHKVLPIGLSLIVLSTVLDSICYGKFILTWLNFFVVNVIYDIGSFYGSNTVLWYYICGLPVTLGLHFLPFIWQSYEVYYKFQMKDGFSVESILLITIFWTINVLSTISHKEYRFLLPLLPMCLHLSSTYIRNWCRGQDMKGKSKMVLTMLIGLIVPAIILGRYHNRGVMDVMHTLAQLSRIAPNTTNLLFLMPCHSTPLYSHIHENVTTRFLTCQPDFTGNRHYMDEADIFYDNPLKWLHEQYPDEQSGIPTHIICFDRLTSDISSFLEAYQFNQNLSFWNTPLPTGRIGAYVNIFLR